MSCADVMYQPYSPYFPVYQRSQVPVSANTVGTLTQTSAQATADYRKYCAAKSADTDFPISAGAVSGECRLRPTTVPRICDIGECRDKEKVDAQYLSANCVVFTYYSGDISSVIDEHFSRALGHAGNSYSTPSDSNQAKAMKDGPPMSHRNFPPSFWNSNYQCAPSSSLSGVGTSALGHISAAAAAAAAGHPDISYGSDPYHHPTAALLHHQNPDPWHYSFSSQAGHFGHHRTHDLSSYHHGMSTVTGPSRFNPQYGSLLLQPSVRSAARLGSAAACAGLDKTTEPWSNTRYHDPMGHMDSNYGAAYGGMTPITGLESQGQESKDLYWF